MRILTHHGRGLWKIPALAAALCAVPWLAAAQRHPSLIDPATTSCDTCHDDVLSAKVIHAATQDCLSCHEFAKVDGETRVGLVAPEVELCVVCHDPLAKAATAELSSPHAPVTDSCTTCHSPHASDLAGLLVARPPQLCLGCHDEPDVNAVHQVPVSRADCTRCHAPHGSDTAHMLDGSTLHAPFAEGACDACHRRSRGTKTRLGARGSAVCFACHSDLEARLKTGVVHTAVKEGHCVGCHDPHLSSQPALLRARGPALCLPCHAEIAARLATATVHPPAADGCDTCHEPHGSDTPGVLTAPQGELCGSCHDVNDAALRAVHLGADMATIACTSCHDPHGSSRPGLIVEGSVHPPFGEGACDACHEGTASRLVEDGRRVLCLACHSEIEEQIASYPFPHAAVSTGGCTACHSPHASGEPTLIRAGGGSVCTTCHAEQAPREGDVAHGIIEWVGCQACHTPHGGTRPKLLVAEGNALCNRCHLDAELAKGPDGAVTLAGRRFDPQRAAELRVIALDAARAKGHPIVGHPVTGRVTAPSGRVVLAQSLIGSELGCRSCHVPHAAGSPELFAFGATSSFELCTSCHPK